jgi:hypothetical protein
LLLYLCWQGAQRGHLSWGEELLGDLVVYQVRADVLQIDPEPPMASHGIETKPVCMG